MPKLPRALLRPGRPDVWRTGWWRRRLSRLLLVLPRFVVLGFGGRHGLLGLQLSGKSGPLYLEIAVVGLIGREATNTLAGELPPEEIVHKGRD